MVGYSTADNYDLLSLAQKLEEQGLYQVMNGCLVKSQKVLDYIPSFRV